MRVEPGDLSLSYWNREEHLFGGLQEPCYLTMTWPQELRLWQDEFCSHLHPSLTFPGKGGFGGFKAWATHLLAWPSVNLSLFQTLTFWYCFVSLCFRQWACVSITIYMILFFSVDRNCVLLDFLQSFFYHCLSSQCFIIFFEWMSDFVVVLPTEGWMVIIYAGL